MEHFFVFVYPKSFSISKLKAPPKEGWGGQLTEILTFPKNLNVSFRKTTLLKPQKINIFSSVV